MAIIMLTLKVLKIKNGTNSMIAMFKKSKVKMLFNKYKKCLVEIQTVLPTCFNTENTIQM